MSVGAFGRNRVPAGGEPRPPHRAAAAHPVISCALPPGSQQLWLWQLGRLERWCGRCFAAVWQPGSACSLTAVLLRRTPLEDPRALGVSGFPRAALRAEGAFGLLLRLSEGKQGGFVGLQVGG